MRQRLYHRLQELETQHARAREARGAPDAEEQHARSIRTIRLFLRIRSVEQTPKESLADAWARALEITSRELQQMLQAEIDPIRKEI
jgi:hypothetical protein